MGYKSNNYIMKCLRQLSSRINELDAHLNRFINKEASTLKKELNNHDLENQSDFKLIDMKMNEILEKFTNYVKK